MHSMLPKVAVFVIAGVAVCRLYLDLIWYVYVVSNSKSPDTSSKELVLVMPTRAKFVQPLSLHLNTS